MTLLIQRKRERTLSFLKIQTVVFTAFSCNIIFTLCIKFQHPRILKCNVYIVKAISRGQYCTGKHKNLSLHFSCTLHCDSEKSHSFLFYIFSVYFISQYFIYIEIIINANFYIQYKLQLHSQGCWFVISCLYNFNYAVISAQLT